VAGEAALAANQSSGAWRRGVAGGGIRKSKSAISAVTAARIWRHGVTRRRGNAFISGVALKRIGMARPAQRGSANQRKAAAASVVAAAKRHGGKTAAATNSGGGGGGGAAAGGKASSAACNASRRWRDISKRRYHEK